MTCVKETAIWEKETQAATCPTCSGSAMRWMISAEELSLKGYIPMAWGAAGKFSLSTDIMRDTESFVHGKSCVFYFFSQPPSVQYCLTVWKKPTGSSANRKPLSTCTYRKTYTFQILISGCTQEQLLKFLACSVSLLHTLGTGCSLKAHNKTMKRPLAAVWGCCKDKHKQHDVMIHWMYWQVKRTGPNHAI
jgi:hypothetical protein